MPLHLPSPHALPTRLDEVRAALRTTGIGPWVLTALGDPAVLAERLGPPGVADDPAPGSMLAPASDAAEAEQREHDRYFEVARLGGGAGFVRGLALAHAATAANAAAMGVTLLDGEDWARLHDGLRTLVGGGPVPAPPSPGWRDGYDPATRWLVGHQLFFALIQGAIVGLHGFASGEADQGLALAAAFLRSSAAAMRFTSDFAPEDYDATVRPAMAPPAVREGFSGLQTRDHAYLVRLFGALKPALHAGRTAAREEFVESLVGAYAAHEFICARFRGDVLPSLRMAAGSRGRTARAGVDVIRDMMRARLALVDPQGSMV